MCLLAFGAVVGLAEFRPVSTQSAAAVAVSAANPGQPGDETTKAKTFTGRIVQMGGKYVLQDNGSQSTLQLDDQDKAKQFEGQDVKVTGTLDTATHTIHVKDIQAA